MKILLALALFIGGAAQAQTVVNFGAAKTCTGTTYATSCVGFTTDNPNYTVDSITAIHTGWLDVSMNGVDYTGYVGSFLTVTDAALYASDGSSITTSMTSIDARHAVSSGRAHYVITTYNVQGVTVTLP